MNIDKRKSNFGKWMDKQKDITILELAKISNLSKGTISTLCNTPHYRPRFLTIIKINQGFKKLGKNIDIEIFF